MILILKQKNLQSLIVYIHILISVLVLHNSIAWAIELKEVIPVTAQNLQGHKHLYNEGWFVVTSSKEALDYVFKQNPENSAQIWNRLKEEIKKNKNKFVLAYEAEKATVVPPAYALSGGVVLSYGTTSQIAAHTLLGVTDAAYLVLSMEGPTYVVYAVTGKLNKGENIPTGAVLDLEKMHKSGEEFKKINLSEEEINKVIQKMENEYSELTN